MYDSAPYPEMKIIDKFYDDALELIKSSNIKSLVDSCEVELLSFIQAVYTWLWMSFGDTDRNMKIVLYNASVRIADIFSYTPYIDIENENFELMEDREKFYLDVINGKKLRAYCFFGEEPKGGGLRLLTAFIDLMLHPLSSKEYDEAPYAIFDFFEMATISTKLFPALAELTGSFFKDVAYEIDKWLNS